MIATIDHLPTLLPCADCYLWKYVRRRQNKARRNRNRERLRYVREELWRRDRCCAYCGRRVGRKSATLDHAVPISRGGSDDPENLRIACRTCNELKSNRTPEEFAVHLYRTAHRILWGDGALPAL